MTAHRWAWTVGSVCGASAIGTVALLALGIGQSTPGDSSGLGGWGGLSFAVAALAFGTVGALVADRLPGNLVGWIFCLVGIALGTGDLMYQYADQVLYGSAGSLPAGETAALLQTVDSTPTFGLVGLAVLLFPDGRPPSRRWRAAALVSLAGIALAVVGFALRPGPLDAPFDTVDNPIGRGGWFGPTDAMTGFGWIFMGAGTVLAAVAARGRWRRAHGLERQQLKWLAFAAAISGIAVGGVVLSYFVWADGLHQVRTVTLGIGFSAFPVAAGIAILRYRLYDIDVVINRALVYGSLTALLAGTYLGSVLLLQLVLETLTQGSGLAVAASTLATAALVRPARARIQTTVDRRFFRRKYDAARTLSDFGARLRDQVDLDALQVDLRRVVTDTMQPAHLALWTPPDRGPA